jgi:hypothetical protein
MSIALDDPHHFTASESVSLRGEVGEAVTPSPFEAVIS